MNKRSNQTLSNVEYLPFNVDATDERLVAEIEMDPMQTHMELASKLGLSRTTVHSRMKNLYAKHVVRKAMIADPMALGYSTCVLVGITTQPSQLMHVADKLAEFDSIEYLMLCMGRFDILALALFRKRDDFLHFQVNSIGTFPGVIGIETMLILKHTKIMGQLLSEDGRNSERRTTAINVDSLDLAVIKELEANARLKSRQLSKKLGLSHSTVTRRLRRLQDDQVIRIATLTDPLAIGYQGVASIGIRSEADKVNEVAHAVGSYSSVQIVAILAGRFDIIAWVVFRELYELSDFITEELSRIPGLKYTETMTSLKTVKAWGGA